MYVFLRRPYKKVFETVKYAQPKNVGGGGGSSRSSPIGGGGGGGGGFQKSPNLLEPSIVTSSASAPRMSAFASYPSKGIDPNRRNIGSSTVYSSFSVQSLDSVGINDTDSVTSDDIIYP